MPTPRSPSELQNLPSQMVATRSQSRTSADRIFASTDFDAESLILEVLTAQGLACDTAGERMMSDSAMAEPEDPEGERYAELRRNTSGPRSANLLMNLDNAPSLNTNCDDDADNVHSLPTLLRRGSTPSSSSYAQGGLSKFKQSLQATREMMQGIDEDAVDDMASIRVRLDRRLGRERLDGLLFGDLLSDNTDPLGGILPTFSSNPYAAVDDALACKQSRLGAVKWEPATIFTPRGLKHSVEQRLGSKHDSLSMFMYRKEGSTKEFDSFGAAEGYSRWTNVKGQQTGAPGIFASCCKENGNSESSDFVCMENKLGNDGLVVPYALATSISEDRSTTADSDDWLLSVSSGTSSAREAGYSEWAMTPSGAHSSTVEKAFC